MLSNAPADELPGNLPHKWLLRPRENGSLYDLGHDVQVAPQ